ncbi:MAG TPA: hypothetical protein VEU32_00255 [Burkholderiales bacterium]|nr:hypothetical protein [Burkholderiales bacterium]
MAGWLQAALKAVLPHAGEPAANQPDLVQQQISELQAAVSQQASHVKELAAQLESTVLALEKAAQLAEARLRRGLVCTALALAFSVAAVGVAVVAVFAR